MIKTVALAVIVSWLIGGCATRSESGRSRVVAPNEVGVVYSEVETQARLVVTPDAACVEMDCAAEAAFRLRVALLAERLQKGAYKVAVESNLTPARFSVSVPGKDDIGTLSTAAGNILVFDGLREFSFPDAALGFLIAREMGHVLARHHEENSATSLSVSVAVALLFPMAQVLRSAETAYTAATATTSLLGSAASFAGARIVKGLYRADQRQEADVLALRILMQSGWTAFEVAHTLDAAMPRFSTVAWMLELQESKRWLDQMAIGPVIVASGGESIRETENRLLSSLPIEARESGISAVENSISPPNEPFLPPPVRVMPRPLPLSAAFAPPPRQKVFQPVPRSEKRKTEKTNIACAVLVRRQGRQVCLAYGTGKGNGPIYTKSKPRRY